MARNLRDAINKHRAAADDLHQALRECLGELTTMREGGGELRLQVIEGGRQAEQRKPGAQQRGRGVGLGSGRK